MGTLFSKDKWLFNLTTPEYETAIFGYRMGELRLVSSFASADLCLDDIAQYMTDEEMLACTFRGKENIDLVRYLNSIGFLFVGTYSIVTCDTYDFYRVNMRSDLNIIQANRDDYEGMINIKKKVFDYSTHQLDPLFHNDITSHRNVLRLKSYFDNPNHYAYICKYKNKVIGYLQFIVDKEHNTALCTNGAIDPDYHRLFIGVHVYTEAFNNIFEMGIEQITSGYCNQNLPAMKIHRSCGFKLKEHEIHLRLHTW